MFWAHIQILVLLLVLVSAETVLDHACEGEGMVCEFEFNERGTYVFQQKHDEISILQVTRFPESKVDVSELPNLQRFEIDTIDSLPDDVCQTLILGERCVKVVAKEDESRNKLCCPLSNTPATSIQVYSTHELAPTSDHGTAPTPAPSHGPSSHGVTPTTTTQNDRVTFSSITDKTAYDNTVIAIVVTCLIIIIIIIIIICIIRQCRKRRRRSSQSQVNIEMGVPSNPLPLGESGSEDTLFGDIMPTSSATSHDKHE